MHIMYSIHSLSEMVKSSIPQMWCLVQEQGMHLKQQLAAVFDQLKAKDTQLSAMHQQLQAQHAQQTQRAQQAQHAHHAQGAHHAQQLEWHSGQSLSPVTAQEASVQADTYKLISHSTVLQQAAPEMTSTAAVSSLSTRGLSTFERPQLQTAMTDHAESAGDTSSQISRHDFVKLRVQELQSRQSSPEKSLSLASSRLNSPRAGLLGSTSRAGLLGTTLDTPRLRAAGSSPRAGQIDSVSLAVTQGSVSEGYSSIARGESVDKSWSSPPAGSSQLQEASKASHSSPRASDSGVTPQQSRRMTAVSDRGDKATTSSAASQDRAGLAAALHWISPNDSNNQKSSLSLQDPADVLSGSSRIDPLPWCGGLEIGSPGMELSSTENSDGDSEAGSRDVAAGVDAGDLEGRVAMAAHREDSAHFGPEASAMSLPSKHSTSEGNPHFACHASNSAHVINVVVAAATYACGRKMHVAAVSVVATLCGGKSHTRIAYQCSSDRRCKRAHAKYCQGRWLSVKSSKVSSKFASVSSGFVATMCRQ